MYTFKYVYQTAYAYAKAQTEIFDILNKLWYIHIIFKSLEYKVCYHSYNILIFFFVIGS